MEKDQEMKSVMNSCCCMLLVGLSTSMVSTVSAETVVLDFADGNASGLAGDDRFEVHTWGLNWFESGFGTDGALYAWNENGQSVGVLDVIAAEGYTVSGLTFDLSGYGDVDAAARFGYYVDQGDGWDWVEIPLEDRDFSFEGNSSLFTISLPELDGNGFKIVLDNYLTPTGVAMDNVSFNIVPAPGALALLGLAGVAGNRRRRG